MHASNFEGCHGVRGEHLQLSQHLTTVECADVGARFILDAPKQTQIIDFDLAQVEKVRDRLPVAGDWARWAKRAPGGDMERTNALKPGLNLLGTACLEPAL